VGCGVWAEGGALTDPLRTYSCRSSSHSWLSASEKQRRGKVMSDSSTPGGASAERTSFCARCCTRHPSHKSQVTKSQSHRVTDLHTVQGGKRVPYQCRGQNMGVPLQGGRPWAYQCRGADHGRTRCRGADHGRTSAGGQTMGVPVLEAVMEAGWREANHGHTSTAGSAGRG